MTSHLEDVLLSHWVYCAWGRKKGDPDFRVPSQSEDSEDQVCY